METIPIPATRFTVVYRSLRNNTRVREIIRETRAVLYGPKTANARGGESVAVQVTTDERKIRFLRTADGGRRKNILYYDIIISAGKRVLAAQYYNNNNNKSARKLERGSRRLATVIIRGQRQNRVVVISRVSVTRGLCAGRNHQTERSDLADEIRVVRVEHQKEQ